MYTCNIYIWICKIRRGNNVVFVFFGLFAIRRSASRDCRCFRKVSDAEQPVALGMRRSAKSRGSRVHILVSRQSDDQLRHRSGRKRDVGLAEQAQRLVHRTRVPFTFRQLYMCAE